MLDHGQAMVHSLTMVKQRTPVVELIDAHEVAARANVSVKTVAQWARDGKLRSSAGKGGRGGFRLFDPGDVEAFLAERAS
jgi:hypothetical protein